MIPVTEGVTLMMTFPLGQKLKVPPAEQPNSVERPLSTVCAEIVFKDLSFRSTATI